MKRDEVWHEDLLHRIEGDDNPYFLPGLPEQLKGPQPRLPVRLSEEQWASLGRPPCDRRINQLVRDNERLFDALEWLVHLHHGVSKDGSREIAWSEWGRAIKSAEAAIAKAKGEGDDGETC